MSYAQLCLEPNIVVIRIIGLVKGREGADLLSWIANELIKVDLTNLVFDFTECDYVDSLAIGELISIVGRAHSSGGSVTLNNPSARLMKLLELAKLDRVFCLTAADFAAKIWFDASHDTFARLAAVRARPFDVANLILSLESGRISVAAASSVGIYRLQIADSPNADLLLAAPLVIAAATRSFLSDQVATFEALLNSPATREVDIQRFLETHPQFILGGDYDSAYPHVVLERGEIGPLVPDFMLKPYDDIFCDLFELKLPSAPLIVGTRNRRRFSSVVAEAVAQLRTYRDYFDDAASRELVRERYGVTAYRPKLVSIIGRTPLETDAVTLRQLRRDVDGVEVVTYDQLLARAKRLVIA